LRNSIMNHKGHKDHEEDREILCVLRVFVVPDFSSAARWKYSPEAVVTFVTYVVQRSGFSQHAASLYGELS